jgi:hypothetical protein
LPFKCNLQRYSLDERNPETLSTLGYSTWSYGDIFTLEVGLCTLESS